MSRFFQDHDSPITRRDFFRHSSTGLAGAALLGLPFQARGSSTPTHLHFSFAPDDSGTLSLLLETFNQDHEETRVTWRVMPRESDAYFRQIRSDLLAESGEIDIIGADSVWTAELAHNGWVRDLTDPFDEDYDSDNFLDPALDSATYNNRVWAVPWYSDAGMLFYRRDLLIRSDIMEPPETWQELQNMATRVQHEQDVRFGYLFQGDEYEGGVANALEFIWNAGGEMMSRATVADAGDEPAVSPETVTIDTEEAARGLQVARDLIADGVAPEMVSTYQEQECLEAFLQGDAVFMRNWPFVFGLIDDPEASALSPEQVGVAPLPSISQDHPSYSCLGGWNLMLNAHMPDEHLEAAWDFIRFATSTNWQRNMALQGGFLPSRRPLYQDPTVVGAMPVIDIGADAIDRTRARPITPYYSEISRRIARTFNRMLRYDLSPSDAVSTLQRELTAIIRQHQQVRQ